MNGKSNEQYEYDRGESVRTARQRAHGNHLKPNIFLSLFDSIEFPDPSIQENAQEGVLLTKPGIELNLDLLNEISTRAAECGYLIKRAAILSGNKLASAAAKHYNAHLTIASEGMLTASEYANLIRIYDNECFSHMTGKRAWEIPVVSCYSEELCLSDIVAWSSESARLRGLNSFKPDGPNELSEHLFVNLYPGQNPKFIVNPHMPGIMSSYEIPGASVAALHLMAATDNPLDWPRMRSEFLGPTDPAQAPQGSLRGDAYNSILHVGDRQIPVSRTNNAFHLSNGCVEAVRDISAWLDLKAEDISTGNTFSALGVESSKLVTYPFLIRAGQRYVASEIARSDNISAACNTLKTGIFANRTPTLGAETCRRIVEGHSFAKRLVEDPGVQSVLAVGSTGMGRASASSDLDLVVIHGTLGKSYIEEAQTKELNIELNHMSFEQAASIASPSQIDLKSLRESARLATAISLIDPDDNIDYLQRVAQSVRPPAELTSDIASSLTCKLISLQCGEPASPIDRHEWFRKILDSAAIVALTRSFLRYHKARWVMTDLAETGESRLRSLILKINGGSNDHELILFLAGKFLTSISKDLEQSTWREIVDRGFAPEIPQLSYACRTLADAESASMSGDLDGSVYTARFATRLGAMAWAHSKNIPYIAKLPSEALSSAPRELSELYMEAAQIPDLAPLNEDIVEAIEIITREN